MGSGVDRLDLAKIGRLDFEPADFDRFPCLRFGFEAARAGGGASTLLNAANEIAVEAFLAERIAFTDIPSIIEYTLTHCSSRAPELLEDVLAMDAAARSVAKIRVAGLGDLPGLPQLILRQLVLAELLDDRLNVGERFRMRAIGWLVGLDRRVADEPHELLVASFHGLQLVEYLWCHLV